MIKNKIVKLARSLPFSVQKIMIKDSPAIFYFHMIGNSTSYNDRIIGTPSIELFKLLMYEMLAHYKPLEDLSVKGIQKANGNHCIVTFDDGLRSVYEIACPILVQMGIPAIIFLNPEFLDGDSCFYRFNANYLCNEVSLSEDKKEVVQKYLQTNELIRGNVYESLLNISYPERHFLDKIAAMLSIDLSKYYEREKPFMSLENARELQQKGFKIGAHSMNHPRYSEISFDEQYRQTLLSVERIKVDFGLNYGYFAFPFSSHGVTPKLYDSLKDSVDLFFTTSGWKSPERDRTIFHRIGLDNSVAILESMRSTWSPFK